MTITQFKYRKAMMHIVYSAFTETDNQNQSALPPNNQYAEEDFALILSAHQQVCHKYREEIMAIRKYLPGWKPRLILNDRMSE